jgi:hypothetical protein
MRKASGTTAPASGRHQLDPRVSDVFAAQLAVWLATDDDEVEAAAGRRDAVLLAVGAEQRRVFVAFLSGLQRHAERV